jgi:flagellar biosynthesis/type III secretory pathway ATPase
MFGAYARGSDKLLDDALARMPKIEQFLAQAPEDRVALADTVAMLHQVVA